MIHAKPGVACCCWLGSGWQDLMASPAYTQKSAGADQSTVRTCAHNTTPGHPCHAPKRLQDTGPNITCNRTIKAHKTHKPSTCCCSLPHPREVLQSVTCRCLVSSFAQLARNSRLDGMCPNVCLNMGSTQTGRRTRDNRRNRPSKQKKDQSQATTATHLESDTKEKSSHAPSTSSMATPGHSTPPQQ